MVCPYVREIIHNLKLVDYLHVQADKPFVVGSFNERAANDTEAAEPIIFTITAFTCRLYTADSVWVQFIIEILITCGLYVKYCGCYVFYVQDWRFIPEVYVSRGTQESSNTMNHSLTWTLLSMLHVTWRETKIKFGKVKSISSLFSLIVWSLLFFPY